MIWYDATWKYRNLQNLQVGPSAGMREQIPTDPKKPSPPKLRPTQNLLPVAPQGEHTSANDWASEPQFLLERRCSCLLDSLSLIINLDMEPR